jgi:hypothetical protein
MDNAELLPILRAVPEAVLSNENGANVASDVGLTASVNARGVALNAKANGVDDPAMRLRVSVTGSITWVTPRACTHAVGWGEQSLAVGAQVIVGGADALVADKSVATVWVDEGVEDGAEIQRLRTREYVVVDPFGRELYET